MENSINQEESAEDSLTETAAVSEDGGTDTENQTLTEMGGQNCIEIEATRESASASKESGIENNTKRNRNQFKVPAQKYKRKAIDLDETERRMEEAYEIIKESRTTVQPTVCTAYGQLVATRLETLSEVNRAIIMNQIDNLFLKAAMGNLSAPGPLSSGSTFSYINQPHEYQLVSPGPVSPASTTSYVHQPQYQTGEPSPASFYSSSSSNDTFLNLP